MPGLSTALRRRLAGGVQAFFDAWLQALQLRAGERHLGVGDEGQERRGRWRLEEDRTSKWNPFGVRTLGRRERGAALTLGSWNPFGVRVPKLRRRLHFSSGAGGALPPPFSRVEYRRSGRSPQISCEPSGQTTRTPSTFARLNRGRPGSRGSLAAAKLPSARTRRHSSRPSSRRTATRAPTASRLSAGSTRRSPSQALVLPTSLRSRRVGPLLLAITTSVSPSLSRSPKAAPRLTSESSNAGPALSGDVLEADGAVRDGAARDACQGCGTVGWAGVGETGLLASASSAMTCTAPLATTRSSQPSLS